MNKYEIEEIISGDSARDEKQEKESLCEWCDTDDETITDFSGISLCSDCNNDAGYN
tara:strand:- start:689 stop:856 length:168 start_codon:yes stop_codon:yes gene_type:complete